MDKLDKLFKDKLDNRTFEFKDAYWEAAEMLIDQDKKDRRRFGFWWWRVGLLLIAIGAVTYFVLASVNNTAGKEASSDNPKTEVINPGINDPALNTHEGVNEQSNLTNPNNTKTITSIPISPEHNQDHNSNSILSDSQSYENPAASNLNETGATHINRETLQAVPVPDTSNFNIPGVRPDTANTKPKLAFQDPASPDIDQDVASLAGSSKIEELDQLETIAGDIEIPETECADCFDLITKTFKPKKINFSVGVEGIYFPKANYPDGLLGAAAVAQVDFRIAKKWALSTGVNYMIADADVFNEEIARYPSGGFDISLGARSEEIYSFGSRTIETRSLPTRMHYIEVPLLLKYKMNKHALTAGVYADILAGVRGGTETRTSVFPWESNLPAEALDDQVTVTNSKSWLSKGEYDKFLLNLSLGYEWRLTKGLSWNLGTFYNISNANKTQDELAETFNELYFTDKTFGLDRFHFRTGLKWHFK